MSYKNNKPTMELTGVFRTERFVFQHGTPQRAIIATLDDGTTIKGEAQPDDLKPGILYRFDGYWTNHPKYGRQFQFVTFCQPEPKDKASIENYLATCPGIGTVRARQIVANMGLDCIRIIKETLYTKDWKEPQVRGITGRMWEEIHSSLKNREEKEGFTIEMKKLLGGKGFPKKIFAQLEADFGTKAPEMIRENPFLLLKYKGVGFERADQVYHDLGKDRTALVRQIHFLCWLVDCDRTGSVWIPEKSLHNQLQNEMGDLARYYEALEQAVETGILVQKDGFAAEPDTAAAEQYCVKTLYGMLARPVLWPTELVSEQGVEPTEHQLFEYKKAVAGPVSLLTGSPGTGKTWLVARVIRSLQKMGRSIAVCAPTGKAALRVVESLAAQGVQAPASTIHSLLQAETADGGWRFKYNEENKLPFDFIIIDESSMIDIGLLKSLLKAVGPTTNVMFVGDPDQLAPVGRGAPLRDMIEAKFPCGTLTEIRRNAGAIVEACAAIRKNERFDVHVHDMEDTSSNLVVVNTPQEIGAMMRQIQAIETFESSSNENFMPVRDMQIIVAVNEKSPLSRKKMNEVLQNHYNPIPPEVQTEDFETKVRKFRPMDKIICLSNGNATLAAESDQQTRVANGDIGYLEDTLKSSLLVGVNGNMVLVPMYSDLWGERDWDLGYAISCHKSQGSEWPVVVVVLDSSFGAMSIADRHWIYTAISRARRRCYLLGNESAIWAMAQKSNMWTRKTLFVESYNNMKWGFLDAEFVKLLETIT